MRLLRKRRFSSEGSDGVRTWWTSVRGAACTAMLDGGELVVRGTEQARTGYERERPTVNQLDARPMLVNGVWAIDLHQ